jgi:hypothetical protein
MRGRRCLIAVLLLAWGCGGDSTGPPPPTAISGVSGDGQIAVVGRALPAPFVVRVTDAQGTAVSGVTVTWAVTAGGGSLSATSTQTDSQGQASVTLTLGLTVGTNTVTASSPGLSGSPVVFNATGVVT